MFLDIAIGFHLCYNRFKSALHLEWKLMPHLGISPVRCVGDVRHAYYPTEASHLIETVTLITNPCLILRRVGNY